MQWISLCITLFFSISSSAFEDTFLLAEIVANTAQEIAELERLITETTKHTEKLSKFAETVDDYNYRAQRLKSWAKDLTELSGDNPEDIEQVNSLLRQIRMIEEDTTRIYFEYSKRNIKNDRDISRYDRISRNQNKNTKQYKRQALRTQRNSGDSMQQVAQNTAAIAYEQSKSNQLMAQQNEKISNLYKIALEKEKRELEKKSRLDDMYARGDNK